MKIDIANQTAETVQTPEVEAPQAPAAVKVIGQEEIRKADSILAQYKAGKSNLEQRVIDNEKWYRLRHWECLRGKKSEVEPTSGWLFNALANKHADAMDNFPAPNILAREASDKAEANRLSSIVPVILDQTGFEAVYSDEQDDKLKTGTGVYCVTWDDNKLGGLGDVSIRSVDLLNVFWEPGVSDIQDSRNFFHVVLADNETLEEAYPELKGKLGGDQGKLSSYVNDDSVDTSGKSAVVDWYYKRSGALHYCKYVGGTVLFASENQPEYADGWYGHGLYPFVFDPLFRTKDSPCGFGFIDVAKSAQEYIDRANQAFMMNLLANSRPRHFIRSDGSVNEEEYADMTRDFVHVDGNLGQDSIVPIIGKTLPGVYVNLMEGKVNELKEVTGNRDVSTGGSTSGVTAASAIAAMQEAGSKLARDSNKGSYRAFRQVCLLVVELIRQFYTLPRSFRIMGKEGQEEYIQYTNENIVPATDEFENVRHPLFDIEIAAQKQSPYSKMAQNELALQFYSAGFFNPQMADQALACLDMMDFDRKSFIVSKIQQNGTLFQQNQMLMQVAAGMANELDSLDGGNRLQQVAQMAGMAQQPFGARASAQGQEALGDKSLGESGNTRKARERVAESTSPT